jgi:hypothetical protein
MKCAIIIPFQEYFDDGRSGLKNPGPKPNYYEEHVTLSQIPETQFPEDE